MDRATLVDLLYEVKEKQLSIDDALARLQKLPFDDLDFAKLDTHRVLRQGLPEIVFAEGKTAKQLIEIIARLKQSQQMVVATRVSPEKAQLICEALPEAEWHETAAMITLGVFPGQRSAQVAILTAGTSDLPVAAEASVMLKTCGISSQMIQDVGVAGIHRLFESLESLRNSDLVIVVAGMDGALPSVVGGLVSCPVIAVPTSVGYGSSFDGLAALLSMLNSCAAGVTVVNIDNGFGAAVAAVRLINQLEQVKQLSEGEMREPVKV